MEHLPNLWIQSLGVLLTVLVVIVHSQASNEVNQPPPPPLLLPPPPPPPPPPLTPLPPSPLTSPPPPSPTPLSESYSELPPPPRRAAPWHRHQGKEPTYRRSHRSPPPPYGQKLNKGEMIGLLFAGIAAILQVGVVGFLVFKRRQLLRG